MQDKVYVSVSRNISLAYTVPGTKKVDYLHLKTKRINAVDVGLWAKLEQKRVDGEPLLDRYKQAGQLEVVSQPIQTLAEDAKPLSQKLAEAEVARLEKSASTPKPKSSKGIE